MLEHAQNNLLQLISIRTLENKLSAIQANIMKPVSSSGSPETNPEISPWLFLVRLIKGKGFRLNQKPLSFGQFIFPDTDLIEAFSI